MAFLGIRIAMIFKQDTSKEKRKRQGVEQLAVFSLLDKEPTVLWRDWAGRRYTQYEDWVSILWAVHICRVSPGADAQVSLWVHSLLSRSVVCSPVGYSPPGFSDYGVSPGKNHWSGLPCPPPGDLPNPGIEPRSPTLEVDSLPSEPPGKPVLP